MISPFCSKLNSKIIIIIYTYKTTELNDKENGNKIVLVVY